MVKVRKDLTGQRFGRLTVMYQAEDHISKSGKHIARWHCVCDCGNEKDAVGKELQKGNIKSCGCLAIETTIARSIKTNTYDLSGSCGIGYAVNDKEFYFDLEDYDKIKDYCWHIGDKGYVITTIRGTHGKCIKMHNLITGHKYVDHIGGVNSRNDNRKCNLRIPPDDDIGFFGYNSWNAKLNSNNKSGCSGVFFNKEFNKWVVTIGVNYEHIYLGVYSDYDEAVRVRKAAEQKYYGEYSYDNSQQIYNEQKNYE